MQIASVFQDHMVLQREQPMPVWGITDPHRTVTVTLSGHNAVTATAGPDGRWRAMLPPRPAGGPFTLHIGDGHTEQVLNDVWVGEVWVASGQSNMQMLLRNCEDAAAEIAASACPGIRMLTVAQSAPTERQEWLGGGTWKVSDPGVAGDFSAAGYYFARELHRALGVTIGIINSSLGGTIAEAWTSRSGLQGDPSLRHHINRLDRFIGPEGAAEREAVARAKADWAAALPVDPGNAGEQQRWPRPDYADADWPLMALPTGWQAQGHDFSGVFWFRREIDIPDAWAGRDLCLSIGACDKRDFTYFDGEFLGSMGMEDRPDAWRTPRVYTVPGHRVRPGRHVIAVRVFSNIYQGGMVGPEDTMWVAPVGARPEERRPLAGPWRFRIERNFGRINAPPPLAYGNGNPNTPTALFNGMIAPLVPYAIRGFIWYQGESNSDRPGEYRTLFPALIRDWRREWGRDDLPFHFVQLANYKAVRKTPVESDWAELREAQRFTLSVVPRTGMAVAIDIGDTGDIHPKNKRDIGRRLAACALARDYGRPEFIGSSPLPRAAWVRNGTVTVRFDHVAGGLAARGEGVQGFALAGEDRVFHWAEAALGSDDTVILNCRAVPAPKWVRYAWAENPRCNLYGGTGLPAAPFESALPGGPWMEQTGPFFSVATGAGTGA